MVKHSYGGYTKWMFPGGGINKGESAEQAAKREILEEVGVEVTNLKKIGEFYSAREYKRDTVTVFAGQSKDKNIKIDPHEIAEASWFKIDAVSDISEYSKLILSMFKI